ncbi:SUKH-4 family immunity protein [Nocardia huaxiensis]|uniref:SUKH-4 family immunity protein n=1 Tax=Nocardia huaxiensis TaxID=2755382 RepID=UPI001E512F25|nr:SUKH-4 family immunity protein [Nocardia huaxiensis]UFS99741.1 SUKH-4 family immunity protein [Nocardia huaxiensis]
MTRHDDIASGSSVLDSAFRELLDGEPGLLYVCGPEGSGKTTALHRFAAAAPDTHLVDAAGLDADSVVAQLLTQPTRRPCRDFADLISALRRDRKGRTIIIANAHRVGSLLSGGAPQGLRGVLRWLRIATREGQLRLIVECDRAPDLTDPAEQQRTRVVELSSPDIEPVVPPDGPALPAVRALAQAQLRRLPIEGWAMLCHAAGLSVTTVQLTEWATEFPFLARDPDGIGFSSSALAEQLRHEFDAADLHAHMTGLLRTGDLSADWQRRSLPGHAIAAGRFDDLLADANALARIPQDALVEAFRAGYPDGIERGTHAASLHYLTGYGLTGAPHGEWVAHLAHDAILRGDPERARLLAESCPEPLLFHTVWSRQRARGDFREPEPWHTTDLETVGATRYNGTPAAVSVDEDGIAFILDATTGETLAGPVPDAFDHPGLTDVFEDGVPVDGELTTSGNWRRTTILRDGEPLGIFHHPTADYATMAADILVMAGPHGACGVRIDPTLLRTHPTTHLTPLLGAHGRLRPRPFDPTTLTNPRHLLEQVFTPAHLHRRTDLPETITHTPTRRLFTDTGVPAIEWLLGITLDPTGELPTRTWHSIPEADQPPGAGPFHLLGDCLGTPLLLDGSTGRVLRMIPADAPSYLHPRHHLLGTTLESFVLMLALLQRYATIHRTAGPDRNDVLAELRRHLPEVDPAATTDIWQHLLHFDEWH